MLNFFRNIRKSLLNEGKLSKYLTYALGEIFLVTIGILLALQVNNWNEKQKSDDAMHLKINTLVADLKYNIKESNGIIEFSDAYNSTFNRVFEKDSIVDPVADLLNLLGSRTAQFYKESLETILDEEERLPTEYKHLILEMKALNRLFQSQKEWEDISLKDRKDISNSIANGWEYDLTTTNYDKTKEDFANIITNAFIRNRVINYAGVLLDENAWDVTQIRASSVILLWKLNKVANSTKEVSVKSFFSDNRLFPFEAFDCANTLEGSKYRQPFGSYRYAFLFYNATEENKFLDVLDKDLNVVETIALQPGQFYYNTDSMYDEDGFEVRNAQNCLGRFRAVRNGYLIIED